MCLPLRSFFKAIREFNKSIRELKSNLKHLRQILSGVLKISRDLEDVTKEVKNIADFYSSESKGAIQDQLKDMMTSEGRDELYYKEFVKHYKHNFDHRITLFLRNHTSSKQTVMAIIEIIQHMHHVVKNMKSILHGNEIKINVLEEIDVFMYQALDLYQKDVRLQNENARQKTVTETNDSKLNIKIFCDKQKVTNSLEESLSLHLGVKFTSEETGPGMSFIVERPQEYNFDTKHLVYRERATRIRKLRHYLSSKIKLKKIGDFYKEELSLQIQFDLKKAVKQLWDFERILHENTQSWAHALRQLPKHRFTEVLEDNHLNDIQQVINYVFTNTPDEIAPIVEQVVEKLGVEDIIDQATDKLKIRGKEILSNCLSKHHQKIENVAQRIDLKEEYLRIVLIKEDQKFENKEVNYDGDDNESNKECGVKYGGDTTLYCTKHDRDKNTESVDVASSLKKGYAKDGIPSLCDKVSLRKFSTTQELDTTIIPNIVSIDPELVLSDMKSISRPAMNLLIKSSSKLAFTVIDKTLLGTSDVVNALSTVLMSIENNDDTIETENKENLFLTLTLKALLPTFPLEDIQFLTKLYSALKHSKDYKEKFLKQLEGSVAQKLVEEGSEAMEYFEKSHDVEERLCKMLLKFLTSKSN